MAEAGGGGAGAEFVRLEPLEKAQRRLRGGPACHELFQGRHAASAVWAFPGHVLVAYNAGTSLAGFDAVGVTHKADAAEAFDFKAAMTNQAMPQPPGTLVRHGLAAVRDVGRRRGEADTFYLMHADGSISHVSYDRDQAAWRRAETIWPATPKRPADHVRAACFSARHGVFFSVEDSPETPGAVDICQRKLLPGSGGRGLHPPTKVCTVPGPVRLLQLGDAVCVAPQELAGGEEACTVLLFCSALDAGVCNVYVWGRGEVAVARDTFLNNAEAGGLDQQTLGHLLERCRLESGPSAPPRLLALAHYPPTMELLALDADGQVFVLGRTDNGRLRCQQTLRLSPFDASLFEGEVQLFAYQGLLGVIGSRGLVLYWLASGACVDPLACSDPALRLWQSSHPSPQIHQAGVWSPTAGFLQFRCLPVARQAHSLARLVPSRSKGSLLAAELFEKWGLELHAGKHRLDALIHAIRASASGSERALFAEPAAANRDGQQGAQEQSGETDDQGQRDAALLSPEDREALLGFERYYSQSPALLLALLSRRPHIRQHLERSAEPQHASAPPEDRLQTDTPLTEKLEPHLQAYRELSAQYAQALVGKLDEAGANGTAANGADSTRRGLEEEIAAIMENAEHSTDFVAADDHDRSRVEQVAGEHPLALLHALEAFLCIDRLRVESTGGEPSDAFQDIRRRLLQLFQKERFSAPDSRTLNLPPHCNPVSESLLQRSPQVPLFELVCRLFFSHKPKELLPFVKSTVKLRSIRSSAATASYFRRAVKALPVFLSHEETPVQRESILAQVELMSSPFVNATHDALVLLLQCGFFADAVDLVGKHQDGIEHIELFHVLATSLLRTGRFNEYAERLWQVLPSVYGVQEILAVFRHFVEVANLQQERMPVFTAGTEHASVDSVRDALMSKMRQTRLPVHLRSFTPMSTPASSPDSKRKFSFPPAAATAAAAAGDGSAPRRDGSSPPT